MGSAVPSRSVPILSPCPLAPLKLPSPSWRGGAATSLGSGRESEESEKAPETQALDGQGPRPGWQLTSSSLHPLGPRGMETKLPGHRKHAGSGLFQTQDNPSSSSPYNEPER